MVCSLLSVATAVVEGDACESGDHVWVLSETDEGGYGGREYFSVTSCEHASYTHNHYYVTGITRYYYDCLYCEATKMETTTVRDYDLGPMCIYHPGR